MLKTSFIGGSLGGFDFDNGLLAFFASFTPVAPDIYTYPVFSTETATNAALILTDTTPKPSILVTRGEPSVVVDGFKVSVLARNCGAILGEGVDITSLTFEGRARSGIDANLLDITSVRLYWDINADGDLTDDPLVGEGTFDDSTLTFTLSPPMTVLPGDEEHFLLSFELDESICPCNTYEALLSAGNIEAITTETQVRPTRVGSSRGRIVLPEPRFATFSSEEMFGGDEQAGFAGTTLPDRLGVRVENFPIDCGQASFKIVPIAGVGLNNALLSDSQSQSPRLVLPFRQENGDAVADVEMTLGDQDGLYAVEATIEFIEPADCKSPRHIFREHAGRIVLEVVDVKNPQFYDATPVSGGPSPWDVKITSDFERLATGGDTRVATTTDGVSMLLIRAKLIGFPEAPPGDVEFSLSGGGDVGSLIASFGGSVPPAAGATSVASPWKEEHGLIKSFALYTPPPNYGEDPSTERALTLTAKYSLPADPGNVQERTTDIALFRPPILFVHGMWSNMNTWGTAYTQSAPRYEKHFADYSGGDPSGSAVSFSDNGTVIRAAVYGIVQDRGSRGIATTQAVVVAHSMGGLLTRQFIADQGGLSYRRPDNFGQGDIDKFITMGTPHWGSPISWLTKSLRESTNPLIQQPFLELINGIGLNIFSGAIDSMCPGSPQLQALGESVVPAHAIQGWYLDTSDPDLADDAFSLIFLEITQDIRSGRPLTPLTVLLKVLDIAGTISTSLLYSFDKTDLLVTNLSQGSDLLPQQRSEFDRTTHMTLGLNLSPVIESEKESQEIAERVFALVDAPVDDPTLFAPKLPAPRVQDSQIQCTASGPAPGLFKLSAAPEPFEAVDRAVSIQYPLDGETVHSGDTLFVTAQAIADGDFLSILFLSPAQGLLSAEAPFQVEMKIPDEVVGRFPIVVAATDAAGQVHVSRPVTLNVVPMATLESMVVTPASLFMVPDSRVRLRIDGIYSDAVSRNLTSAKTGTFYQSLDEQIASVGETGIVEAHAEGQASILISNGRIDQIIKVRVGR